jgi:hypothetical protein
MKTYFAFACFIFMVIGVVWGQPILLYQTGNGDGKFVLSRNYGDAKVGVSEVIISDSFAVRRAASYQIMLTNSFAVPRKASSYQILLTNALILRTKSTVVSLPSVTTNFEQYKFSTDVWVMNFPSNTQVLFNNSMTDLEHVQLVEGSNTNVAEYEGEAAIKKLKEMGLKPPDDMDWEKATNK